MPEGEPEHAPERRRPWWRRVLLRLALLCGSLLVFLGLCEVVLRVAGARPKTATALLGFFEWDATLGWKGRPNAGQQFTTSEADVWITHNPDGLRSSGLETSIRGDPESAPEVVWCVGDSTTWGWGVPDGATWVDELNRISGAGRIFRNLGATGYSALQEYLLLKHHFEAGRKPHRVIVLFCSNDVAESLEPKRTRPYFRIVDGRAEIENRRVEPGLGRSLASWLTSNSLVCNHIHYYYMRARRAIRDRDTNAPEAAPDPSAASGTGEPAAPSEPAGPDPSSPAQIGLRAAYGSLRDLCTEQRVKLHVATPYAAPDLDAACVSLGIPLIDLSPYWDRHHAESKEPTRLEPDPHWNELGHRIVARALHAELYNSAGR